MFIVDLRDVNSQTIEADLDGTLYYIVINWNETNKNWTIGLRNSAYEMVLSGISAVPNYPLFYQFRYSDMPEGELMIVSKYRNGPVPRLENDSFFMGNYQLIYITRDDLEEEGLLDEWGRI